MDDVHIDDAPTGQNSTTPSFHLVGPFGLATKLDQATLEIARAEPSNVQAMKAWAYTFRNTVHFRDGTDPQMSWTDGGA